MKKSITCLLLASLAAPCVMALPTLLHESFLNGIPAGFTVVDRSGAGVVSGDFAPSLSVPSQWFTLEKGVPDENYDYREPGLPDDAQSVRYAALSCSRRSDAASTDNWLVTPRVSVKDGTILRWTAKSMHYDYAEDYKVLVSESGLEPESFKEIFSVSEDYFWTRHAVDLSSYAGKDIYVAFVHTSDNKFILGLDDISIDMPDAPEIVASLASQRYFAAADDPVVSLSLQNIGQPALLTSVEIRDYTDAAVLASFAPEQPLQLDSRVSTIDIPLPLSVDQALRYKVFAIFEDGSESFLFDDFANRSSFRRRMFIQKFTGTWCNSCPKVAYTIHNLMHRLGSEAIYAEAHHPGAGGSDKDGCIDYIYNAPLRINADYPALWFNQKYDLESYKPKNLTPFYNAALMPCKAGIEVSADKEGQTLSASARVTFAEDIDNSDSHLRVAFIVVNTHEAPTPDSQDQTWQLPGSFPFHGEFYFLPTRVNKDFTSLHNVIRGPGDGVTGAESSLPASIVAGQEYVVPFTYECPADVSDSDMAVIANIVDNSSRTMEVLNSSISEAIHGEPASVSALTSEKPLEVSFSGGMMLVTLPEATPGETCIRLYDLTGRLLATHVADAGSASVRIPVISEAGTVMIMRLDTPDSTRTAKIIVPGGAY